MKIHVDIIEDSQKLPGGVHIGHFELVYFRVYDCFLCDIKRIPALYELCDVKVLVLPFKIKGAPVYFREFNADTKQIEIYNYEDSNSRFT